jgi:hypothetical protein
MNEMPDSVEQGELARRLASLRVPGHEKVLDGALAAYRSRPGALPRRRLLRPGFVVAVVLASVLLGSAAVAAASFSGQILQFVGLAPKDEVRIQSVVGSATSSGQTVKVLGAYGDVTRTVVFIHTTMGGPVWATLTADSGQKFSGPSQVWERDGYGALAFGPLASPNPNGDGVTLQIMSMMVTEPLPASGPTLKRDQTLKGDWRIHFSVKVSASSVVPTPTSGKLGAIAVTFKKAGGTGDSVFVSFETVGRTIDELQPAYCSAYGWCSKGKLRIQMFDPSRKELKLLQGGGAPAHSPGKTAAPEVWAREMRDLQFDTYWTGSGPGSYRLVLSYEGQQLESTFAVP